MSQEREVTHEEEEKDKRQKNQDKRAEMRKNLTVSFTEEVRGEEGQGELG